MKKRIILLGVFGFALSLVATIGVLTYPQISSSIKTNIINITEPATTSSLSYETRIKKGNELFNIGNYKEAITEYGYAIELDPQNSDAYQKIGETYLRLHDNLNAITSLEKAWQLNPSEENLSSYASSLITNKNWDSALEVLNSASEGNQTAAFYKGMILAYQENTVEAKANFEKALSLSGKITPALIQNFINAYTEFESSQNGQNIYLNALITKAYIDAEEYQLSEEMALKILNEKPDYRDTWILLGYSYLQTEQYQEAETAFIKAKSIDSVKPEIHYFLGLARYLQNDFEGAIEELELSILYGFEPQAESYKKMAESEEKLGKYEDALASYEYLLNIDQSSVNLFEEPIKIAIENVKDLDRALTLANLATTTFPNEALSHELTAEVYLAKNELGNAETEIKIALDLDPSFAKALYIDGLIKSAQGDLTSAKEAFKKAYESSSKENSINALAAEKYNALIIPTK